MKSLLRYAAAGALAFCAQAADFSYYMLVWSYTPNYCAQPGVRRGARECSGGAPPFLIHGLWPQNENGRGPENCGKAPPVPANIVKEMLRYMPDEAAIQREWTKHGSCAGLSAPDYFATVRRLADSMRMPGRYADVRSLLHVSPQAIENDFGQTNPGIPRDGFRVSCYADHGLQEVRICFGKDLIARPCTGAPDCSQVNVVLRPTGRR